MNKKQLIEYLKKEYKDKIEEAAKWMEECKKEFDASKNPKKSWAKACSSYMKGGALTVYFAACEVLLDKYENKKHRPKKGNSVANINLFQDFVVDIQCRCIPLHTLAQKELNNIDMSDTMDQLADLLINKGLGSAMVRGYEPPRVKNGVVIED